MTTAANENKSTPIYLRCSTHYRLVITDFAKFDISTSGREKEQHLWSHYFVDLLQKRSKFDGWTFEIRSLFWFFLSFATESLSGILYLDHHQ